MDVPSGIPTGGALNLLEGVPLSPRVGAYTTGRKVLLVDDSKTVLSLLRTYLMGVDLEFLEAANGRAALRIVMRERPDLVISDVEMPEMTGLDLCRAIRSAPVLRRTRLVLISSKWTGERQAEADQLEVDAQLEKPIDGAKLARLVREWFS